MYKYTVGQNMWECYSEVELLHNNKYTKEEFLNICKEAFNKLDIEDRKIIVDSDADEGTDLIERILIKEYGFRSDVTTAHVHVGELFSNFIGCEHCSKSYILNDEYKCSKPECEFREFLNQTKVW